jgi:hypothetical protein
MATTDYRLLNHWQRERAARESERAALPASWRDDSLPGMHAVREAYVEAMLDWKRSSRVVTIGHDYY